MIHTIVKYGHPALRTKGEIVRKIDDDLRSLVDDMLETMEAANGVGLAAQQIGMPLQLAVIDVAVAKERPSTMWIGGEEVELVDYMPLVLINPKLEQSGRPEVEIEGCLSFPEITEEISRPEKIHVKTHQMDGSVLDFEATGLLARAVQHEYDHLQGVLFIDRMNSAVKASLAGYLKRMKRMQETGA